MDSGMSSQCIMEPNALIGLITRALWEEITVDMNVNGESGRIHKHLPSLVFPKQTDEA